MKKFWIGILIIVLSLCVSVPVFAQGGIAAKHGDNLVFKERITGSGAQIHFGEDDDGLDVKFFGETSGAYVLFDESADAVIFEGVDLNINDSDYINFGDSDDVTLTWDGTRFVFTPAADDTVIRFAPPAATQKSFDLEWYGNTQNDKIVADASANKVTFTGIQAEFDGVIMGHVSKSANYTATVDDCIIGVDTSGGAVTITLPSAGAVAGKIYIINDEGGAAGTNNITVATEGSETINGADTQTISANYGSLRVYSDGTNFFTW